MKQPDWPEKKAAVERALQRPVRPGDWKYLVERGLAEDLTPEDLVEEIRALEERDRVNATARAVKDEPVRLPPDDRLQVLARLIAERIEQDQAVRAFRHRHLGDALLPTNQVGGWVVEQQTRDGPATSWGEFPAIPVLDEGSGGWGPQADARVRLPSHKFLFCNFDVEVGGINRERWETIRHAIYTKLGGALDELREITERLATETTWAPEQVADFVLTGRLPSLPAAWGLLHRRFLESPCQSPLDVSRVELRIYPSTPPPDVTKLYRELRNSWLRDSRAQRPRRWRKRLPGQLVAFVRERTDLPWAVRLSEWNSTYPAMRYGAVTNMQRDYARALKLGNGRRQG